MLKQLIDLLERPLNNGHVIGRYKVIRFIGKGSYGLVYLALDLVTKKTVIMKQQRRRKEKHSINYLKREAEILLTLNHLAIPKCLGFFRENNQSFLIMDYIDGKTFEELILADGRQFDEGDSLRIILKVLEILKYIHDNRIIHRDLRLPNILVRENQLYVIDFGLALSLDKEILKDTDQRHSPLEKKLFREPSMKSDFYALGHFLLFLLYSDFEVTTKKEKSWEEELLITSNTKHIIRKLLRIAQSYENVVEIIKDIEHSLSHLNL